MGDVCRQASQRYYLIKGFPIALLIAGSDPSWFRVNEMTHGICERYTIDIEIAAHTSGCDIKSSGASYYHL
jgi:hypothetical protein